MMCDFNKQVKKLVKKLRYCSNPGNCNSACPNFSFDGDCIANITKEAADVIEELLSVVEEVHDE